MLMCATRVVADGPVARPAEEPRAAPLSCDALTGLRHAGVRWLLTTPARRGSRVLVSWRVPARACYAQLTRHWFRGCLALLGERGEAADDAELVFAELVGNAARHTRAWVQVTVLAIPGGLRVEIADQLRERPRLTPGPASPDDECGRGLALVDALAARWGVRHHPRGKTVWFEHRLSGRD